FAAMAGVSSFSRFTPYLSPFDFAPIGFWFTVVVKSVFKPNSHSQLRKVASAQSNDVAVRLAQKRLISLELIRHPVIVSTRHLLNETNLMFSPWVLGDRTLATATHDAVMEHELLDVTVKFIT
ncbi:hypothetical protein Tco_1433179, partial [Tanacetum coccineum]